MTHITIPSHGKGIAVLADRHWDRYVKRGSDPLSAFGWTHDLFSDLDALTAAFHSDLSDMIKRHVPEVWFFGHSHRWLRAYVGKTDIRNVSLGYPDERPLTGSGCIKDVCMWEG